MATLALSLAGQMVGGIVGGPFGATLGRALGALAGSAIDGMIFGGGEQARPVPDVRITGASEGTPIPRLYGWSRLAGTVIWAADLEMIGAENGGAKGFAPAEDEEIVASFALGLCEGEIAHIGRIWADGKLLDTAELTIRTYRGTEDQMPDAFIAARQGGGEVPGYRGLAYLVFERLPLRGFGNRMPNISVEVCRIAGDLEPMIRAVCVIPGATEYGYDLTPRLRLLGPGRASSENNHRSALRSDWDHSIDELVALCPNLEHVGLVVTWFGDDLRAGHCTLAPRSEGRDKAVEASAWSVAGRDRAGAGVVSTIDGGPAYGGTPTDESVIAAIADLRARGLKVTLYPFVMMDIGPDNALPDPYGGARQAAFPWRGRITCHPAPGRPGSVDGTPAAAAQIAAFVASGYRDMILHYAALAKEAGGVDAFLVGSELVGLTTVRSGATSFPFVAALREIAGAARAVLGPATRLTYGADWTEYHGYQPPDAPGDKIFHLDPLWADAAIDAVGIDNYMPMADWRGTGEGPDGVAARDGYALDYLRANMAGGEGYDWYYASEADRVAGTRTPIADGPHGEPFVWRFKDLRGWWGARHHNRVGGVRSPTPTAWVPQSKPIWLTEIGCGAVDKGANAPNAFGDPKSAENKRPYFSSGVPDALMQRQTLRAIHHHWRADADNPLSPVYGGAMVDVGRLYIWCWDARPFPAFPDRDDAWSDAANYETGHWLNGRLGGAGPGEMLARMSADYGVPFAGADDVPPLVTGLAIDGVGAMRDGAAALLEVSGLQVRDGLDGLHFIAPDRRRVVGIDPAVLVRGERAPVLSRRRGDPSALVGRLTLSTLDRARDYQSASVIALSPEGEGAAMEAMALVLDPREARRSAEMRLARLAAPADTIAFSLPPEAIALGAGDLVMLDGEAGGPFLIEEISDRTERAVRAGAWPDRAILSTAGDRRRIAGGGPVLPVPAHMVMAHLPDSSGQGSVLVAGAFAQPWPGRVTLWENGGDALLATLTRNAHVGTLTTPLVPRSGALWDKGSVGVVLFGGHLAGRERDAVLAGANAIAIQGDGGAWEVLGFADATLVAPRTYRLGPLLRGQRGTMPVAAGPGAPVLVLGDGLETIEVPEGRLDRPWALRVFSGARDGTGAVWTVTPDAAPARRLAPVHLAGRRVAGGDIVLSWRRRTRIGGDDWSYGEVPLDAASEHYRVEIGDGAGARRVLGADGPALTYTMAQQLDDFGAPAAAFTLVVRQVDPVTGPGAAATALIGPR